MMTRTRSSPDIGEYDPWIDLNDDGYIDVFDAVTLSGAAGTFGDPTRNVNVTNWPIRTETFPKNLVLRGTWQSGSTYTPDTYYEYRSLIDEDTPYANPNLKSGYGGCRYDCETIAKTLNITDVCVYNQTFIYEKIPMKSYQILGMTTVSLTYNMSNTPSADYTIMIHVKLGVISTTNAWTELVDLESRGWAIGGAVESRQYGSWLNARVLDPITVNVSERIAVQIEIHGYTTTGTTNLWLSLLGGMNTDEFLVGIPIVESP
jgi:hypothetical protein